MIGIATALPAAAFGTWRVSQLRAANRIEADRELQHEAEALSLDVSREVDDHVRAAETLADTIARLGALDDLPMLQSLVTAERRHLEDAPFVLAANAKGISIACDPPVDGRGQATTGINYSDRDYFREMMETRKTAISRVQIGKRTGRPNIQIATPVFGPNGQIAGYISISLDPALFQQRATRIAESRPGYRAIVLDRENQVMVHPSPSYRERMLALSNVGVFAAAPEGETEIRTGLDEEGNLARVGVTDLSDVDWRVIVSRSWADIDREADTSLHVAIAAALATLLLGAGIASVLSEILARPVTRLAQDVTRLRAGERIPLIASRFVTREVAILIDALSDLVAEVRAHETHLEATVADRTASLETANAEIAARLQELKSAQSQLVENGRMAAIGQLAAGVAHEINNPASFTLSNLTYLEKNLSSPARDAEPDIEDLRIAAKDALEGAERIRDIVKDVRVLSRGNAGPEALFDLNDAVRSAIRVCRGETLHRAEVSMDLQDALPVRGNVSAVSQIFLNLIVNAAQAMPAGRRGRISVRTRDQGGVVVATVTDDGCGIAPENLPHLFEPFFTTKANSNGVGLGLSIALDTLRRHRGTIEVHSKVGEGTRFELRLPLAPVAGGTDYRVLASRT
jgi:signal transduction histidine kinase